MAVDMSNDNRCLKDMHRLPLQRGEARRVSEKCALLIHCHRECDANVRSAVVFSVVKELIGTVRTFRSLWERSVM